MCTEDNAENTQGIQHTTKDASSLLPENTTTRIITSHSDTYYFIIKAGVLQGDTLAPYLFVIVLDYIIRAKRSMVERKNQDFNYIEDEAKGITDLDFDDDIAVIRGYLSNSGCANTRKEDGKVNTQSYLVNTDQDERQALKVGKKLQMPWIMN